MKIAQPKLLRGMVPVPATIQTFHRGAEIERMHLQGAEIDNLDSPKMILDEVSLHKITLINAALNEINVRDVEVIGSDLSAAVCVNGTFTRVLFQNCRLSGIDLSRCKLQDVTFDGCRLDMANFRFAKLSRVSFANCSLDEADFQVAELHDVELKDSTLERATFEQSKVLRVDGRSSQFSNIRGWRYLKGLTIDQAQLISIAPELALDMGIKVED